MDTIELAYTDLCKLHSDSSTKVFFLNSEKLRLVLGPFRRPATEGGADWTLVSSLVPSSANLIYVNKLDSFLSQPRH